MRHFLKISSTSLGVLLCVSASANEWWDEAWTSRKALSVDTSITGADIKGAIKGFPLLVRLHAGNFNSFSELHSQGDDLRWLGEGEVVSPSQIEQMDQPGQMAIVWVRIPELEADSSVSRLWMYYGNDKAISHFGADVYDQTFLLVYHFAEGEVLPRDATAQGHDASESRATTKSDGWIGAALRFEGEGAVTVAARPTLRLDATTGWSYTAWIKSERPEANASVFEAAGEGKRLRLQLEAGRLRVSYEGNGQRLESPAIAMKVGERWHHVGLTVQGKQAHLYLEGEPVSSLSIPMLPINPTLRLGGSSDGHPFMGLMDEVQLSGVARSHDWMRLSARSQSPEYSVVSFHEDETQTQQGGETSIGLIIKNVTIDGWIVIAMTGMMFVMAAWVTLEKGIQISRLARINREFIQHFKAGPPLSRVIADRLSNPDSDTHNDLYQYRSSPLHTLYQTGLYETIQRLNQQSSKVLSSRALATIRVVLESILTREYDRLNRRLVLLTIAISGGPFLGLLGTVMGVMITFAVIAKLGEVNINSIAPGISAALLATVAGLAVAIPSLFSYNYLLSKIKTLSMEMKLFTEEYLALLGETISDDDRSTRNGLSDG